MKKLLKSHSERLDPVKLYLDDIERILDIIRETCPETTMETDEYAVGEVAQLESLGRDSINTLDIECSRPYITLQFRPYVTSLYIGQDTAEARGVFEKVKTVLVANRRRPQWLISNLWFATWLGVPSLLLFFAALERRSVAAGAAAILGFVLAGAGTWWAYELAIHRHSVVVLRRRSQGASFWKRNRDRIITGIILSVIDLAAGSMFTLLIQWLLRGSP